MPHWLFGMKYDSLAKSNTYGLHKIYEMVINNSPAYAYLVDTNSLVEQKLVMAHVYAHSDFFRNNLWFAHTNRKAVDQLANHAVTIRKYAEKYGQTNVESLIDIVMSLENLIDYHSVFKPKKRPELDILADETRERHFVKLKSKEYMDKFINPPDLVKKQKERLEEAMKKKTKFPAEPEKDVLFILMEYAPLENWQRHIISIIREEMYYFAPQQMTKIMNEGWASFWHSRLMTKYVMNDGDVIDYASLHSGTMGNQPGTLNPYKIGMELFRDVEDRWNKGKFGKEYENCTDSTKKDNWNLKLGLGKEKILEVRRIHNDITFIDEFLTKEFCERHKLFTYKYNPQNNRYEIADRDFENIRSTLLKKMTNLGNPIVTVENCNYENRGELMLVHHHYGNDLDLQEAIDTLKNLQKLWQRPVNLHTIVEGEKKILHFDGIRYKENQA
jgi:stage V sporulation protein R